MSTRQYIGARYVPKFFSNSQGGTDWESGVAYEPLTIVTYNSNSYTSKKVVPSTVGAPNANPEYWASTGIYSAQIEEYRQEVEDLADRVDDLDRPKRFLFVGDSYDTVTATRWSTVASNILGLNNSVVVAQGGYGFVTGQNKKWIDLLTNTPIADEDAITDVVIGGGANDAWAPAGSLGTAIADMDSYLKNRFVNLKNIYLGFMGNSYYSNAQHRQMTNASREYIENAAAVGWHYLHNIETTLYLPSRMQVLDGTDYIHPSESGVRALGRNVAEAILTGRCTNKSNPFTVTFTKGSEFASGTFDAEERIINDQIKFGFSNTSFVANSDLSAGVHVIGTCGDLENIVCGSYINAQMSVNGSLKPCTLIFTGYKTLNVLTSETIPSGATMTIYGEDIVVFSD